MLGAMNITSSFTKNPSFLPVAGAPNILIGHQHMLSRPRALPGYGKLRFQQLPTLAVATVAEPLTKTIIEMPVKFKVEAVLTVRKKVKEALGETFVKQVDALSDKIGRNVVLQLVSTEVDPYTKRPKRSEETVIKGWLEKANARSERVMYTVEFMVDSTFGVPGAITVTNKHQQEFFLESIVVDGFACGPVHFCCNSWVQSVKDHPRSRVFFNNMPYLPMETPAGLKELRVAELKELRGDGKGERRLSDRIYDYDVYNDLGNPDRGRELARPVLSGKEFPYPRRCRTGRPPMETERSAESRAEKPAPIYVPRDEAFEETKRSTFSMGRLKAVLHGLLPLLIASLSEENQDFKGFHDIDRLYREGLLVKLGLQEKFLNKFPLPKLVSKIQESSESLLRYDQPKILSKDRFAWLRDDEFARQTLAGVNPVSIKRLQSFPPVSNLDPAMYGPQESAIREEDISPYLGGRTVQQAMRDNKLYILDHHDIYMPFLERINALDGRKSYATRTLFFLNDLGTLKPIAIELSLPATSSNCAHKKVLTPPHDATSSWSWQLAKTHVCCNDAGVHQLAHHWLRTHACIEPFILSAHRHLSAMHPIFKLLDPHMRYTLEINALARQSLINAGGVIESCFTPGPYCMEISSAAYRDWRFDMETLPADLIRRGMAVPDSSQPHGLKLLIEDYPYAADGLLIWSALERWIGTYVKAYYTTSDSIQADEELQSWYRESIEVGHADKRDEPWWPRLSEPSHLVSILTTLIWLASAQHAALNFGQYPFGGYMPNRAPLLRRLIPDETDPEHDRFVEDPQRFFLSSLPRLLQATKYMAVVDTLSTHSPDEEYLGQRQPFWSGDGQMVNAFHDFATEIRRIEETIEGRNKNPKLRNRCGAGVLPYELLAPTSAPGVTCRGVPNSASI